MRETLENIALAVVLIAIMIVPPLLASQASTPQAITQPGKGVVLGGPKALINPPARKYDPVASFNILASKVDANNNGIADKLEAKLATLQPNETVKINVIFGAKPAALGGDKATIIKNLIVAMKTVEALGGKITHGPWKNAIVGFSAEVPASIVKTLATKLSGLDIDGNGLPDRILIEEDQPVHKLNHWSSKQMGLRPYVWNDLKVKGYNVTVVVIDTGIDGNNSAFANGKIVYWADYVGDPNGVKHDKPYDDNMHGTHVSGTVAGYYNSTDPEGRFVLNFGISDLNWGNAPTNTWLRFRYPLVAYYVNATGTIELDFIWKPDTTATSTQGAIGSVAIGYCGWVPYYHCTPEIVNKTLTPNANTWYKVTYKVTSSSQFGWYTLMFNISKGGGLAFLPILHVPVNPDTDTGAPYNSGMAPEANLGGAKVLSYYGSGSDSVIAQAIDDVVGNRTLVDPHLYIISMSLGGGYSTTLDQAITNAANAGVLSVVAAGNEGGSAGDAATGSPANNTYALTIAAVDALNNITDYSSSGGTLNNGDIKPDVAAPGGGYYMEIFSADTTWHDDLMNAAQNFWGAYYEDIDWNDTINMKTAGYDDSLGILGTSMATPHVSGLAADVVSALINNASITWDWNSYSTAGLVKMIIEISAAETYPLMREPNNASYSPTLDRGAKDIHEGFGAVDGAAAVDLALSYAPGKAIMPGSSIGLFFRNGTAYNANFSDGVWNKPWGRSVYAYRIFLPLVSFKDAAGNTYYPVYVVKSYAQTQDPDHTDFDLYAYNVLPDKYGNPVIVAKSTNGVGVLSEAVQLNASKLGNNQFIVAVKRAMENATGGYVNLLVGPFEDAFTPLANGGQDQQTAYTGYNVTITGWSAYGAPQATIKIVDNTTGTVLDTLTVTTTQNGDGSSFFAKNWTVPNDSTLDGHQLLFIVTFQDSSGTTVEGPTYDTLTVSTSAAPIPESPLVPALVAVLVALIAAILLYRRQ